MYKSTDERRIKKKFKILKVTRLIDLYFFSTKLSRSHSQSSIMSGMKLMNQIFGKDGPFEFVLDIINSELVVMEIFEGGIIHKHGGVKVGDVLLVANNLKLNGRTFPECQLRLEKAMEDESVIYCLMSLIAR
jgi:hypothetical protein